MCFPVNFEKFLRTFFLADHLQASASVFWREWSEAIQTTLSRYN